MFKPMSVAEFEVDGHKAKLIIDNEMPISTMQAILNRLMHFCVDCIKAEEDKQAQLLKDQEAEKLPELEESQVVEEAKE